MLELLSIGLTLLINFSVPENKKLSKNNEIQNKLVKGFPYSYFEGENLTDEMIKFRIKLIYRNLMLWFLTWISLCRS
jgi:hypothetical protein